MAKTKSDAESALQDTQSHVGRNTLILLVVAAILISAAAGILLIVSRGPASAAGPHASQFVKVTGDVVLSGKGDSPINVIFIDSSGKEYSSIVAANQYAVLLPNGVLYKVLVGWKGDYPWQSGNVSASELLVNQTFGGTTELSNQHVIANAPDSNIDVMGSANVSDSGATPILVVFVGGGQEYYSPISGGTYSVTIPNLQSYSVQIQWQTGDGRSGQCTAGSYFASSGSATQSWTCA